jgi:hypothetical protein
MHNTMFRLIRHSRFVVVYCMVLTMCAGCAAIGIASRAIPQIEPAKYKGLTDQKVGVMAWVDRGVRIDFPSLRLDITNGVQRKLIDSKSKSLGDATFPFRPDSIVRYQKDHPEIEATPITDVAPKLGGLTRLIFIEVEEFRTRSEASLDLYRGSVSATVKVVEIYPDGTARIAFEENSVRSVFPEKSHPEGIPGATDYKIYQGLLDAFTTEVALMFIPHEVEP